MWNALFNDWYEFRCIALQVFNQYGKLFVNWCSLSNLRQGQFHNRFHQVVSLNEMHNKLLPVVITNNSNSIIIAKSNISYSLSKKFLNIFKRLISSVHLIWFNFKCLCIYWLVREMNKTIKVFGLSINVLTHQDNKDGEGRHSVYNNQDLDEFM